MVQIGDSPEQMQKALFGLLQLEHVKVDVRGRFQLLGTGYLKHWDDFVSSYNQGMIWELFMYQDTALRLGVHVLCLYNSTCMLL